MHIFRETSRRPKNTRVAHRRCDNRRNPLTLLVIITLAVIGPSRMSRHAAAQCIVQERAKLLASDFQERDEFGSSVSVSGDVVIVGAEKHGPLNEAPGAAYVYRFSGTSWTQGTKLLASDGEPLDGFGHSVSISGDVAIVGADREHFQTGAAYVFRFNGTNWVEEARLIASDRASPDQFGISVSISGDVAVVGAEYDDIEQANMGSAYVYRFNGTTWIEEAKLLASGREFNGRFGNSVSICDDVVVVAALYEGNGDEGAAYVYRFNGTTWIQEAKLIASDIAPVDRFGQSVSVSGNVVVVGAHSHEHEGNPDNSGSAYVYRFDGSSWVEEAELFASDGASQDTFGWSVSVSEGVAVVGARLGNGNVGDSGSAYLFRFDGSEWIEEAEFFPSDGGPSNRFGWSVSVRGNVAVVAANRLPTLSGAAYIFGLNSCEGVVDFDPPSEFDSLGIGDFEATGPLDPSNNATNDLVVVVPDPDTNNPGDIEVFFNDGINPDESWRGFNATTFTLEVGREPSGVDVGSVDSDADAFLDFAVSNAGDGTVSILISNGDGTFASDPTPLNVGTRPSSLVLFDYNDDTVMDLGVSDESDDEVTFYLGDGFGGFILDQTVGAGGVFTGRVRSKDVDNDKDLDVVGVNGQSSADADGPFVGNVFVMINTAGTFSSAVTYDIGMNPQDLAVEDIDGDGFADVVAVNTDDDTVSILLNDGDGTFSDAGTLPVGDEPLAIDAVNLDIDPDVDIAVVCTDPTVGPAIQVLQNFSSPGVPVFAVPVAFEVEDEKGFDADPRYVIHADLNEDGRSDLTTVNENTVGGSTTGSVSALLAAGSVNLLPAHMSVGGVLAAGDVGSLYDSDDDYLVIADDGVAPAFARRRISARPALPMIRLELLAYTIVVDPEAISVTVEAGVIADRRLLQRALMRSFEWEQVHLQTATVDDSVAVITPTGDLRRFVDVASGTMRLRVEWVDPGQVLPPQLWMSRIDQAIWTVTP